MRIEPILVVAGSNEEACHFARDFGLPRGSWIYVTRHLLKGRMNPRVFLVGDYWRNPDWATIESALAPTRARAYTINRVTPPQEVDVAA